MSVYMPAPATPAAGPDGKGWNRLRIEAGFMCTDECALKPRSWQSLWIAQTDTRRSHYGTCGPCGLRGDCDNCPVWAKSHELLTSPDHGDGSGRMLARIDRVRGLVWLMVEPELGWDSVGYPWTWEDLARLSGWVVERGYQDEHSEGFWLRRVQVRDVAA